MATLNAVQLYLSGATMSTPDIEAYVKIYAARSHTYRPAASALIGTSQGVAYTDLLPLEGGPKWITFTFETPIILPATGFYGITLAVNPDTDYNRIHFRWHGASDWNAVVYGSDPPYEGKEIAYYGLYHEPAETRAYKISADGLSTSNSAEVPQEETWYYGASGGELGMRFYVVDSPHSKPFNPTPPNNAVGVDWSTPELAWDGDGETYAVRVATTAEGLLLDAAVMVEATEETSYTLTPEQLAGLGDLGNGIYWRVDSTVSDPTVETLIGDLWTFELAPTINSVRLGGAGSFVLCATTRGLYLSSNFGGDWLQALPDANGATEWKRGVCSSTGTYMIAERASDGTLYRSSNGGGTWDTVTPAGGDAFTVNDMAMSADGQFVMVVGANSTNPANSCFVSTNHGVGWTVYHPTSSTVTWTTCDISDDGDVIAVGATSHLYVSFDAGATWTKQTPPGSSDRWNYVRLAGDGSMGIVANTQTPNEYFRSTAVVSRVRINMSPITETGRTLVGHETPAEVASTLGLGETDSPTFAGLTLAGLSGVLKATTGAVSGSATLDDVLDGVSYGRVAANQLSTGVYIDAAAEVKGIASFDSNAFSVVGGAVSLIAGGGLDHNDLGSLQGGMVDERYHLTATEYGYVSGANAQSVLITASPTFVGLNLSRVDSADLFYMAITNTESSSARYPGFSITNYDTGNIGGHPFCAQYRAGGTQTVPLISAANRGCGAFIWGAYDGTSMYELARIAAFTDADFASDHRAGHLRFYARAEGESVTGALKAWLYNTGVFRVLGTVRADTAFNHNGTDGITVTDTVVTAFQDNAGQLQYKTKTMTFAGGIRTATGIESEWTNVPSV